MEIKKLLQPTQSCEPSEQDECKVIRRGAPTRARWWAECQCLLFENNGLVEVFNSPLLIVPRGKIVCHINFWDTCRQWSHDAVLLVVPYLRVFGFHLCPRSRARCRRAGQGNSNMHAFSQICDEIYQGGH